MTVSFDEDDGANRLDWVDPPSREWQDAHGWRDGRPPPNTAEAADDTPLVPAPWVYRDPSTIPPRQWLIGTILLRDYATILGSAGGVGKTALAITLALAFITGRRDILGLHVFQTGKVWILTLEDDREELERRIAAAMIAHGIAPEAIAGRLFVNAGRDRPLLLARADEAGTFVVCEDAVAVADGIRTNEIGLTIIDPLVKSHALVENDNVHMDKLEGLANDIAARTRSAILLACHFRKDGDPKGARDSIRGGGALVDAARIARTLVPMTAVEAEALNVAADDAKRFIRVNDAKANLAPKDRALWIQLTSVELGNGDVHPAYPSGDHVQAAKAWQPPQPFDDLDLSTMERVLARLREPAEPGWFYSSAKQAKFWAGQVIIEETGKSKSQAATILTTWLENGVLTEQEYKTPNRNESRRIVVVESKVAEILSNAFRSQV